MSERRSPPATDMPVIDQLDTVLAIDTTKTLPGQQSSHYKQHSFVLCWSILTLRYQLFNRYGKLYYKRSESLVGVQLVCLWCV